MKQAFLIIAHNQFNLLKTLVQLLSSDERCDVYVHIDKKSQIPCWLSDTTGLGKNVFLLKKRVDNRWGDFSQIETELELFKSAYNHGPYTFYHLLSGVDLPIKPIGEILNFFEKHKGKEFVGFAGQGMPQPRKVMRYHFFTRH